MTSTLGLALLRLVALQKEAIPVRSDGTSVDAVPYWPYVQEGFPYFWNRVNSLEVQTDLSSDIDIDYYTIEMGMVVAHWTAGYKGENYANAADWIDDVRAYFEDPPHNLLATSTATYGAYTSVLDAIWIEEGGAVITGIPNGMRTIGNSGANETVQIYLGFILALPLMRQRY